jgi:hypothetical protein
MAIISKWFSPAISGLAYFASRCDTAFDLLTDRDRNNCDNKAARTSFAAHPTAKDS